LPRSIFGSNFFLLWRLDIDEVALTCMIIDYVGNYIRTVHQIWPKLLKIISTQLAFMKNWGNVIKIITYLPTYIPMLCITYHNVLTLFDFEFPNWNQRSVH
jgi:hypothetical protein